MKHKTKYDYYMFSSWSFLLSFNFFHSLFLKLNWTINMTHTRRTHSRTCIHNDPVLFFVLCEQDFSLSVRSCNPIWKNIQFLCDRENLGGKSLSKQQLLRLCYSSREQGLAGREGGSADVCQGKEWCLGWIIGERSTSTLKSPFSNKTGLLFRDGEGKHTRAIYFLHTGCCCPWQLGLNASKIGFTPRGFFFFKDNFMLGCGCSSVYSEIVPVRCKHGKPFSTLQYNCILFKCQCVNGTVVYTMMYVPVLSCLLYGHQAGYGTLSEYWMQKKEVATTN